MKKYYACECGNLYKHRFKDYGVHKKKCPNVINTNY